MSPLDTRDEHDCWDGVERRRNNALPETCYTLHDAINRQNEQITARLDMLQTTTDNLVIKIGQWESNARLLRWLALAVGAAIVWLIDKGLWIKEHMDRH